MRIKTKTSKRITISACKHITFSKSDLDMLETVERERAEECANHSSCSDCPFRDTFFCHCGGSISEIKENSREIKVFIREDEQ